MPFLSGFKLKTQYVLLLGSLVALVTLLLSFALLLEFRHFSENSNEASADTIAQTSFNRAVAQSVSLTDQLANNLANPLYFLEFEPMGQLITVALAHPDIDSVMVLDQNLRLIHKGGRFREEFGRNITLNLNEYEHYNNSTYLKRNAEQLQLIHPVLLGENPIGWVLVNYSLAAIQAEVDRQTTAHKQRYNQSYVNFVVIAMILTAVFIAVGIALAYQLAARLEKPIVQLANYAKQIGQGNFDTSISLKSAHELEELSGSLNKMADDLKQYTQKIEFLAFHDSLTNLPNRRYLLDTLKQVIKISEVNDTPFALLFVDIDNFKAINDRYGHDAGDYILTSLVKRIKQCIRSSDIVSLGSNTAGSNEPVLARLAGDEFVVILPDTRTSLNAATVSERILAALAEPHDWQDSNILLSVSIGIASYPENGKDADTLLKNADSAMYHVKENNKNNYYFFSEELNIEAQRQRILLDEIRRAIRHEEFELWFQPQVNIHTGSMLGAEALLRWNHPDRGILGPDSFIPTIEDSEFMHDIGLWVIEQSLLFLRSCRTICPDISISVNVSASQLKTERLLNQLREMAIDKTLTQKVHLEITETFLLEDEAQAQEMLGSLQQLGFLIWLDDFGIGYSALSHLKSYPVVGVKIDKSFAQGSESQWENRTLTQAILSVADAFNIHVIAEGVETEEQKNILQGMGCDVAQGFLFAHPMPKNDLLDFLTSSLLAQKSH